SVLGILLLVAGCGNNLTTGVGGGGGEDGGAFDLSASVPRDMTAGGCLSSSDCDGGGCVAGACCATAAGGAVCCQGGDVCLFDRCVTPGKACHTANDCMPGQYCETGLGSSDGGTVAGDAGANCMQALPLAGRCLDLPPVCDVDAGVTPD